MKTYNNDGFCQNCKIGINRNEIELQHCTNCGESFEIEKEFAPENLKNKAFPKDHFNQTQMQYDGYSD